MICLASLHCFHVLIAVCLIRMQSGSGSNQCYFLIKTFIYVFLNPFRLKENSKKPPAQQSKIKFLFFIFLRIILTCLHPEPLTNLNLDQIRIRLNQGLGSGSRRAKMTHDSRNNLEILCFEVLGVLF